MKLREYPGIRDWPPMPGGAFLPHEPFPIDETSVVIAEVFPVINEFVTFTCDFNGRPHAYDLQTRDQSTAEGLAFWLTKLIGKTLDKFGEFRLDVFCLSGCFSKPQ